MDNFITIACISDTHGYHRSLGNMPEADILFVTGDFTLHGDVSEISDFDDWLGTLDYKHIVIIAGNHEKYFYEHPIAAQKLITNAIYLQDSSVTINGFKIYGSPWTPEFNYWYFMKKRNEMNLHWVDIPVDTDILLTHGPPFGVMDRNNAGFPVGDDALANRVQIVKPIVHAFGHIHPSYGERCYNGTIYINSSIMGTSGLYNKPIVMDIYK